MTVVFDGVAMPWGEEPVAIMLTSIDDWSRDEKLKANSEGKVNGGHSADQTLHNVERGGRLGALGAGAVILMGSGAGAGPGVLTAGGAAIAGGMLGGVLLTKGGEVRLNPGTTLRVKFVKPLTLPVIRRPGAPATSQQQLDSDADDQPEPGKQIRRHPY